MQEMVLKLDDWGKPAWIAVMVLGFVLFWPIGLGILAYLIWSGRMGCGRDGRHARWQERMASRWEGKMKRWGMAAKAYQPTGNAAFDEYREESLRRLEQEAGEFQTFLDKLRMAKDKAEFEQFMTERRRNGTSPEGDNPPNPSPSST